MLCGEHLLDVLIESDTNSSIIMRRQICSSHGALFIKTLKIKVD